MEQQISTAKGEFYVGEIYSQGKLVPQDLVEAAARFQVAANENLDDARKMLDELEPKVSPEQKNAVKYRYKTLEGIIEDAKADAEMNRRAKKY